MKNIRAVIFDFDGVTYLENPRFSSVLSKKFNIPIKQILSFFQNELVSCQLGKKDLKIELARYLKKWQINSSVEKIMKMWFENGKINREVVDLVKKLKEKGIICLLITSNEKYRLEYMKNKFNLDSLFDKIITSYDIGARKPDKKVFRYILDLIKINPEECLFIDDSLENVKVAQYFGMKVILWKNKSMPILKIS